MVKNIELLNLPPAALDTVQAKAAQHLRYANIEFSVSADDRGPRLMVSQGKPFNGIAFEAKRLIEIGRELFGDAAPASLRVGPIPFLPSPADVVTPSWLDAQIRTRKMSIKQMAADLGVNKDSISSWRGGNRNMSASARAMFYYYFQFLDIK